MKKNLSIKNKVVKNIFASLVGFINGFFGGGGGLICVPTLEKIYGLDEKKSHATAIMVMFPLSLISLIIYSFNNNVNFYDGMFVSIGVLIGGCIGAIGLKKLNKSVVKWIFIIILFTAGFKMVV